MTATQSESRRDRFAAWLPLDYSAQPVWGFEGGPGRPACVFHHVYGPPVLSPRLGLVSQLDRERSHWAMTIPGSDDCWWVRFSLGRSLLGPRLSFEHFSSLAYMGDRLPWIFETFIAGCRATPAVVGRPGGDGNGG